MYFGTSQVAVSALEHTVGDRERLNRPKSAFNVTGKPMGRHSSRTVGAPRMWTAQETKYRINNFAQIYKDIRVA